MINKKMLRGDILTLKGITGHGKNRIREHGECWVVLNDTTDIGIQSRCTPSPTPPIRSVMTGDWRWFKSEDFEIVMHCAKPFKL